MKPALILLALTAAALLLFAYLLPGHFTRHHPHGLRATYQPQTPQPQHLVGALVTPLHHLRT